MDNTNNFKIEPTEKQSAFITHTQRYGCFSGAYGSGKSYAGCLRALILSKYPKNVGLIGRLCYDDKTEILTEKRGWVLFKDLLKSDKVATLHNEEDLVFEYPINYYQDFYKGEMIGIKNGNYDLLVTPEHKLWVRWPKKRSGGHGDWKFKQAQEIYNSWDWEMKKDTEWNNGENINENYMEFLGFWFAEGHASFKRGRHNIVLTQSKFLDYVVDLLKRNKFEYSLYERKGKSFNFRLKVNNRVKKICKELILYGKSTTKFIPEYIKNSSKKSLQAFLHGYIMGDGHYRIDKHDSTQIWTSSPQMADDLQEIGFKAGYVINIKKDRMYPQLHSFKSTTNQFVLTVAQSNHNTPCIEKEDWYKKSYKGNIYCVQVSTGKIYVRRNYKAVWSSNSYRELADTTRKTFFEICPPEYYDDKQGGRWSPTENNLRLTNGSEILFRHLDTVSEAELKSLNLGWFFIDQAEEIGLPVVRVLMSRLRLNTVPNRFGFFSCNPEPGSWLDTMFKTPYDAGTLDKDFFYQDSTTYDNPYNPPEYVEDLKRRYPPELVKRYVEGSWAVMENIIYGEFEPKVHVVNPFQIPKEWEHIIVLDHGLVNPTGVLFMAIDYDYNIFLYDEYYSPGIVSAHAKAVKEKVGDQEISLWLIDPSTQAKTREKDGRPFSIIEEYEDYGLYFIPANNQKLAGINRVKEFLKINSDRINPITRQKGSPRLFVFKNCVNFIWEIKQYKWRKLRSLTTRNSPEEPIDYADHLMDCLYMGILSRFPPPSRTADGRAMILPADRINSNVMSVDNSQTAQADEVLGQFADSGDSVGSDEL